VLSTPTSSSTRRSAGIYGASATCITLACSRLPNSAAKARRHFRNVTLYGQGPRGNTLHALLKTVDIFNLRHRLIHSPRVQRQLATTIMGQDWRQEKMSFRFSRLLVRQSPITVGVASGPRVREGSKSAAER
jgi:hypothetical protein